SDISSLSSIDSDTNSSDSESYKKSTIKSIQKPAVTKDDPETIIVPPNVTARRRKPSSRIKKSLPDKPIVVPKTESTKTRKSSDPKKEPLITKRLPASRKPRSRSVRKNDDDKLLKSAGTKEQSPRKDNDNGDKKEEPVCITENNKFPEYEQALEPTDPVPESKDESSPVRDNQSTTMYDIAKKTSPANSNKDADPIEPVDDIVIMADSEQAFVSIMQETHEEIDLHEIPENEDLPADNSSNMDQSQALTEPTSADEEMVQENRQKREIVHDLPDIDKLRISTSNPKTSPSHPKVCDSAIDVCEALAVDQNPQNTTEIQEAQTSEPTVESPPSSSDLQSNPTEERRSINPLPDNLQAISTKNTTTAPTTTTPAVARSIAPRRRRAAGINPAAPGSKVPVELEQLGLSLQNRIIGKQSGLLASPAPTLQSKVINTTTDMAQNENENLDTKSMELPHRTQENQDVEKPTSVPQQQLSLPSAVATIKERAAISTETKPISESTAAATVKKISLQKSKETIKPEPQTTETSNSGQPKDHQSNSLEDIEKDQQPSSEPTPTKFDTYIPYLPARQNVQQTHLLSACGQTEPIDWEKGGLRSIGLITSDSTSDDDVNQGLVTKIGEATYSEVFLANFDLTTIPTFERTVRPTTKTSSSSNGGGGSGSIDNEEVVPVAVKILPFGNRSKPQPTSNSGDDGGVVEKNVIPQTTLRDLYQEIGATLSLSQLSDRERIMVDLVRNQTSGSGSAGISQQQQQQQLTLGANFVKAYRICICKGKLPSPLLKSWDKWKHANPKLCENARPDYYQSHQLFAVFILEYAGETLELTRAIKNWKAAQSIVRQLTLSLAIAEQTCQFEHRDLHWGNILVTRCDPKLMFVYRAPTMVGDRSSILAIPSYGVRCTVIDYTLSRLHVSNYEDCGLENGGGGGGDANGIKVRNPKELLLLHNNQHNRDNHDKSLEDGFNNVFYVNLRDEDLFTGSGDYQFEVYRQMRKIVGHTATKSNTNSCWVKFCPETNAKVTS
ncbi:hypothetical protein H4219_005878, partial [Mycoemilia scoparia]